MGNPGQGWTGSPGLWKGLLGSVCERNKFVQGQTATHRGALINIHTLATLVLTENSKSLF